MLFVFLRNSCKPDMVLVYIMLNKLCLSLSLISQNIPRVCMSWKSLLIYVFATYNFLVRPQLTPLKQTSGKLQSGRKHWSPYEIERGNCNYCHPNIGVGKSNCIDNDHLKNVNVMVQ